MITQAHQIRGNPLNHDEDPYEEANLFQEHDTEISLGNATLTTHHCNHDTQQNHPDNVVSDRCP